MWCSRRPIRYRRRPPAADHPGAHQRRHRDLRPAVEISGFYGIEFNGASYVTLANLHITGGAWGVYADDNAGSKGLTIASSVVDANSSDVYIGTGDTNFTLTNSTISNGQSAGVYVSNAANAQIINSTITVPVSGSFAYGVYMYQSDNAVVRNDTFNGNGSYAPRLLEIDWSKNALVDHVTASNSNYYAILLYRSTGTVQNSTVNITGGSFGIEVGGYQGTAYAIGNTVYGENGGNSSEGAILVDDGAYASNNVVYNSNIGFRVSGTGIAENNRVYGSQIGIYDTGSTVRGNKVYDNVTGIIAEGSNNTITNNFVYDNTTAGIQVGLFYSSPQANEILSNTIVQTQGTALNLRTNTGNTDFRDNIISLQNAIGIVGPASAQAGFRSDYNLWNLQAGATLATWSGQTISTLRDWKTKIGFDNNSLSGDPAFVNAAGADGIRGAVGGVDHGADDDFSLQTSSPALNRGDLRRPTSRSRSGRAVTAIASTSVQPAAPHRRIPGRRSWSRCWARPATSATRLASRPRFRSARPA